MTKFCPSSYNAGQSNNKSAVRLHRVLYQEEKNVSDISMYAVYAVLYELNRRELKKKLDRCPPERHYAVVLASSIIGAENAKRVAETPEAAVQAGNAFVAGLLEVATPSAEPGQDLVFREVLEEHLIAGMKDELGCCCPNCAHFSACLDIGDGVLGRLFLRRVQGEETQDLKEEIARETGRALRKAPHLDTDDAAVLCGDFRHQYRISGIGEVFSRYAAIAQGLQDSFGLDYRKVQQAMILINMDFAAKNQGSEDKSSRQTNLKGPAV